MTDAGVECLGDLGLTWQEQRARFAQLVEWFSTGLPPESLTHLIGAQQGDRGDGGALVYLFETPDGTLFYQDTSGHWSGILGGLRPDVAILAAAGRGNVDGEPIQGSLAGFVARQVELLQPAKVVLSHHDDWLPGFSVATDLLPIRAALAATAPTTRLLELTYLDATPILP
jgi:L-ascorbate metabolism protein UlaG (beta-lactamase superfamily)